MVILMEKNKDDYTFKLLEEVKERLTEEELKELVKDEIDWKRYKEKRDEELVRINKYKYDEIMDELKKFNN